MTISKSSTGWVRVSGRLYRRGSKGIYYARYERNGKETWKSLRTKTNSIAQTKLAELEAKQAHSPQAKTANTKTPILAALIAKCLLKWEKRRAVGDLDPLRRQQA